MAIVRIAAVACLDALTGCSLFFAISDDGACDQPTPARALKIETTRTPATRQPTAARSRMTAAAAMRRPTATGVARYTGTNITPPGELPACP